MKESLRKRIINRSKAGITLIIFAAILSQLVSITQYIYTRRAIKQQAVESTYKTMQEMQRVLNLKTSVETAVQNAMGDVLFNLNKPDMFYGIASRLVSRNKYIVGSAVAMMPGYYSSKDKMFAPFAYPESNGGQPRTKLLPYDYTAQEWYSIPFKADSAMWSEPYTDIGGSDLLVNTFSQPIHDSKGKVIGILTADVSFKELTSADPGTYNEIDKVNLYGFILQIIGLLLILYIVWRYATKFHQVNNLIIQQEMMSKELQIASDIQNAMLPSINHQENARHHVELQDLLVSAPDVSADYFDYFYAGSRMILCIGDVPGSNITAAMMMSVTRSAFRTAATLQAKATSIPSPAAIISLMNHAMCTINHNQMFSTLFVCVIDLENANMTYCSAGNPAPVLLNPATGAKLLDINPNIPIGIMDDYEYQEQKITLIDDFTLFFYNDGLYETENIHHEPYGQKRMLMRLDNSIHNGEDPKRILSRMKDTLESFRGEAPQTDDVLMLALKII